MRRCPQCNVENQAAAARCLACGDDISMVIPTLPTAAPSPAAPTEHPAPAASVRRRARPSPETPVDAAEVPAKSGRPRTAALVILALLVLLAIVAVVVALLNSDDEGGSLAPTSVLDGTQATAAVTFTRPAETDAPAPPTTPRPSPTTVTTPVSTVPGDLAVAGRPMSRPPCDGRFITVVASMVTPDQYAAQTAKALRTFAGTEYLRTDQTCPSLRPSMPDGAAIYVAYYGPYATAPEACASTGRGGPDAYVKVLDDVTPATATVACA
jgi:serine/threonine-protein kinase